MLDRTPIVDDSLADSLAVSSFMAELQHPHKDGLEQLRRLLCSISPEVREAIKWRAPSFRTHEYFATLHVRAKQGFGVIFHLGVKKRRRIHGHPLLEDPRRLLCWLADDRAMVQFADAKDVARRSAAFLALAKQWVHFL